MFTCRVPSKALFTAKHLTVFGLFRIALSKRRGEKKSSDYVGDQPDDTFALWLEASSSCPSSREPLSDFLTKDKLKALIS